MCHYSTQLIKNTVKNQVVRRSLLFAIDPFILLKWVGIHKNAIIVVSVMLAII